MRRESKNKNEKKVKKERGGGEEQEEEQQLDEEENKEGLEKITNKKQKQKMKIEKNLVMDWEGCQLWGL